MTLPKTLTTLIGSAAALALLPAMAASTADTHVKSLEVSTSGYDLSKSADAQIIYYKIKKAAKRVCSNALVRQTLREQAEERACRDEAIERAVSQLDEPVLTLVMNTQNRSS